MMAAARGCRGPRLPTGSSTGYRRTNGSWKTIGCPIHRLGAPVPQAIVRNSTRTATSGPTPSRLGRLAARFEELNSQHPLLVRGAVGVVLYAFADGLAQLVERRQADAPAPIDYNRMGFACSWRCAPTVVQLQCKIAPSTLVLVPLDDAGAAG